MNELKTPPLSREFTPRYIMNKLNHSLGLYTNAIHRNKVKIGLVLLFFSNSQRDHRPISSVYTGKLVILPNVCIRGSSTT